MDYTISKLAKLSGVSPRALRYYDQIGLLRPARGTENGYRLYGEAEVDRLQQILFYRRLGVPLEEIDGILSAPDFDREAALEQHLSALLGQKAQLEQLIGNVTKTLRTWKGESSMTDQEKFEGFQQACIAENEKQYGKEIRARYGDEAVDGSNAKFCAMTQGQWSGAEALRQGYEALLKQAVAEGNPAGAAAQRMCDLHRQWLCAMWKDGAYSKEAHRALTQGYVDDPRFRAYYEAIAPGAAAFLRDAAAIYCGE